MGQNIAPGFQTNTRYRQLSRIKRGNFGTVYMVKKYGEKTRYALKKISLFDTTAHSAVREMTTHSALPYHPCVVSLLDHFIADGMLNLVMELCDIGTLNAFLTIYGGDDRMLRSFMSDMADGLQHLHNHNIVHRDIKPDNVLLCSGDLYPRCKLSDFGLSRFSNNIDLQYENYLIGNRGSCYFTSPEVLTQNLTKASDIFSLGVVFYAIHTREGVYSKEGMLAPTIDGMTLFWQASDWMSTLRINSQMNDSQTRELVISMTKQFPNSRCSIQDVVSVMRNNQSLFGNTGDVLSYISLIIFAVSVLYYIFASVLEFAGVLVIGGLLTSLSAYVLTQVMSYFKKNISRFLKIIVFIILSLLVFGPSVVYGLIFIYIITYTYR